MNIDLMNIVKIRSIKFGAHRNVSESKKHEMCTVLHSVLNPVSENLLLLSKEAITDNLVFETDQVHEVNEAEFFLVIF
jgi:hypothetical protein